MERKRTVNLKKVKKFAEMCIIIISYTEGLEGLFIVYFMNLGNGVTPDGVTRLDSIDDLSGERQLSCKCVYIYIAPVIAEIKYTENGTPQGSPIPIEPYLISRGNK